MIRRRRTFVSRRSGPRRRVVIAPLSLSQQGIAANNTSSFDALSGLETALGASLMGCTVLRIRGRIYVRDRLTTVTAVQQDFAYGWIMSSSQVTDLAAGHPNPLYATTNSDRYSKWMWRSQLNLWRSLAVAVGDSQTIPTDFEEFDVRSKRKMNTLEDTLVFATASGAATGTLDWVMNCNITLALA